MNKQTSYGGRSLILAAVAMVIMLGVAPAVFAQKSQKKPAGTAPTKAIVEGVLKSSWDKSGANYPNVKAVLTLNDVKFGKAYVATAQEVQVEGLPKGGMVTPAIVNFTVRTYYNTETQALRRVREARVYKNKFGEWAVMTGSVRGEDTTTKEAAEKAETANQAAKDKPNVRTGDETIGNQAGRDENGFPKPDFSEMERYFEIVRTDYDFSLGRFNMLVKMTKNTNVLGWYMTFYDSDGVKVIDRSFNANIGSPPLGEPTKIYGYTPTEREMKQVTRIAITRRPN